MRIPVNGNSRALSCFRFQVERLWRKWLSRRRPSAGRYEADWGGERPADGQTAANDGSGKGDAPGSAPGRRSRRPRRPRKKNPKIGKTFNCRLTCLPQVCEGSVSGNERMRTMPDDTTQRCHRLAPQDRCPRRRPAGPRSGRSIPPIRSDLVGAADTLLAATQPARPILAYPPPAPQEYRRTGVDKW